jgi:predicted transcriptional regulator
MNVFADLQRGALGSGVKRPSVKGVLTKRIVAYIKENPGHTAWLIRQGVDAGSTPVLQALYRLDNRGTIFSKVLPARPGTTAERTALYVKHYWSVE